MDRVAGAGNEDDAMVVTIVRLLRVEHWIKNLLVLFPAFFVNRIFDVDVCWLTMPALLSFSFAASAIYIVNDIFDVEKDRKHPVKCSRPIASGAIGVGTASAITVGLILTGFAFSLWAHRIIWADLTLGGYLVANIAYSTRLKHNEIVDVFVLASGFVFRIFYGGFYFGIPISSWLFLCVFSGALFFAFGKRRGELRRYGQDSQSRPVLAKYNERFLDAHYYLCCALMILFYCLWTITRTDQHSVGKLALTIPVMFFMVFRYNLVVEKGGCDADPVSTFLNDKWLLLGAGCFLAMNFVVLYLGQYLPKVYY